MIKLNAAVVVEGKYDKIKLDNIIDALIIKTDGFAVFKDKEKRELIKAVAQKSNIIVLTDSDSAGNLIRNYLKSFISSDKIINVYIPQIAGKEKRKKSPSKEGMLGVEGLSEDILLCCFEKAGVIGERTDKKCGGITKAHLFEAGLTGCINASENRKLFLKKHGFPQNLTCNAILDILNHYYSYEEAMQLLE